MPTLRHFRFWCQSVLPLVYDDSLSYYEVLCKVVDYINKLIDTDREQFEELDELKKELDVVKEIIDNFDPEYIEKLIEKHIATMIFVYISDAGYIVYQIPDGWESIVFRTTGLDIEIPDVDEYGRLVLTY